MIAYHVDPARHVVVTRVTGPISFGDFADHLQRIFRDPKFDPAFHGLVVVSNAAAIPPAAALEKIKPLVRVWALRRAGARWAIVLPDPKSRAFAESAIVNLKITAVTTRCFLSENSALAWLDAVMPAPRAVV